MTLFKRKRRQNQSLTKEQLERYSAQLALPGMTVERQLLLSQATVLMLGLNATGATCAMHLAQSGIGKLILVDCDLVKPSDLTVHPLLTMADVGDPKTLALSRSLQLINPDLKIEERFERFDAHNAESLLHEADLAVEGLRNWQDKLLASDNCMHILKPLIHAGLMEFSFHVFSMIPGKSACLRCVFSNLGLEDLPAAGPGRGELGAIAGLAGAFQAAEAIKIITRLGTISGNHLLRFDVLRSEFDDMTQLTSRSDCPDCGRWG